MGDEIHIVIMMINVNQRRAREKNSMKVSNDPLIFISKCYNSIILFLLVNAVELYTLHLVSSMSANDYMLVPGLQ